MKRLRAWMFRLCGLFRTEQQEEELAAEMESHLQMHIDDNLRSGMTAEQARRDAVLKLGGVEQTKQAYRDRSTIPFVESLLRDIRYALRGFRRNPVFTITVIATLTLGIGATTAVFSVVDLILFRPLPYAEPSRIVSVGFVHSLEPEEFMMGRFYVQWQDDQRPFSALASQSALIRNCDLIENNPEQLSCISFQGEMLPLLGVSPILGRNFLPEEDRPHGPRVVMISYALWQGHYSGNPHILGRMIDIDGNPARIVGVLPKNFQFPTLQQADVIFPMAFSPAIQQKINGGFGYPMRVFARVKPGVTIAQAYAEMRPLFDSERKLFPPAARNEDIRLVVRSLRDRETQAVRPVAWILLGFVLAVLVIACANVAGLMMARAAARQRELAVRSAIGASRVRLARQALTEALLLSFAGAVAGLVFAKGLLKVFIALAPSGIPFLAKARLDLRVAAFAVLLSCICGVVFGLASALQKPRLDRLNARTAIPRSHALLRRTLVTAQIAVSIVLLSGAALLLHSFEKIENQSLGMQTGGVLTANAALPSSRYNTNQKTMEFYLSLESALRRPGTRAVAIADSVPPGGWHNGLRFSNLAVQGEPPTPPGMGGDVVSRNVTPNYFRALDIPIFRGPGFSDQNGNGEEREAVLSSLLAARLFPGEDPIGRRIQTGPGGPWFTVVGVADNVKNSGLTKPVEPEIYFLRRNVSADWDTSHSIVLIDSVMPPSAIALWVRSQIAHIDPTVSVDIETLNQQVSKLAARPRFETTLLGFFAFSGLVMAIIGLYGVISFVALQRTQEIGVRMALGASKFNILRLILWEGVRLIVLGSLIGMIVALALSHVLKKLLFNISPYDPMSFIAVALLLIVVALAATLVPASSAMKVDPAVALRNE